MMDQSAALPQLTDFQGQSRVYRQLQKAISRRQFVHAYLITGPEGVGKRSLARVIAQGVLCREEGEKPCGQCDACSKVASGNHADMLIIGMSPREIIKVDTIRTEVLDAVAAHTVEGGQRVIIIEHAHKMNAGSQNALLKTLEEPAPGNVFILVSSLPRLLLPTIRSRCQELRMHPWDNAALSNILRHRGTDQQTIASLLPVCEGSIGKAVALSQNASYWQLRQDVMTHFFDLGERSSILPTSAMWSGKASGKSHEDKPADGDDPPPGQEQVKDQLLHVLEDMVRQVMLVNVGQAAMESIQAYPPLWHRMAESAPVDVFIRIMDAIREARKMKESNVTWQAVIERLLFQLLEVTSPWQT